MGKNAPVRLGARIHEQVGDQLRVVTGIVGQDIGRQRAGRLGAVLVAENRGQRSRELGVNGPQGLEPGAQVDGTDLDHCLGRLTADLCPARILGIVECQAARGREQARIARLGRFEHRPNLRGQAGLVRLEGVTPNSSPRLRRPPAAAYGDTQPVPHPPEAGQDWRGAARSCVPRIAQPLDGGPDRPSGGIRRLT